MLAIVFENNQIKLKEISNPIPPKGEALIRVLYSGICNTDLEIVKGYMGFDGVIGHEFVGVVENSEDENWIGKRVVGEINYGCEKCEFCRQELNRHCPHRTILGILNRDGAHAQYVTLPISNLYELPKNIDDKSAVFIEPLAAALEICEQIHLQPGVKVTVIGDGKLGQLIALVLNLYPVELTVIGKSQFKLDQLIEKNINVLQDDQVNLKPQDIVVECSGVSDGLQLANSILKPRGTLVLKSTYHDDFPFNPAIWIINEINLIGSRCGPFQPAIDLLKKNMIDPAYLISKVVQTKDGLGAFNLTQEKNVFKVLIDWQN